ncbi:TadE/TadG family type IV pilus assembly protein [Bremerella sp. P1]|uniref:TadE/TadG family type IV pilus assembly protein n=1 Tax=Bremerella sp. P1 TaxID=3026424 RepID=UPI002367E0AD|nr:hypothetical protein [Bremerella sp. P1]WDI40802.1 hypothetical protein PSR63_20225 [Bremerella sp. P1]
MTQLNRRFDFLSKRARRGVSLLWIIIAFPALMLFLVFAVEIGNIWLARLELEQSLEANALAAVKQWAESGGGDTLIARDVGNEFSIANSVRRQDVDLTDMTLNTAFTNGANRLNYDDSGMAANPNQNLVCTDITDYNSYLQPGVMVFGAIIQTENLVDPAESVIFNADVIPSCAGPGSVLIDATGSGNLQTDNNHEWGIAFEAIGDEDAAAQANLRIYRVDINVDPDGLLDYEFTGTPEVADTLSNPKISGTGMSSGLSQNDNFLQEITTGDIIFSITPGTPELLTITFSNPLDLAVGLTPGDRFRFGANVIDVSNPNSNTQVDGDEVGGVAEVTVYFSYNGVADSMEMGTLVDTMDKGNNCGGDAYIFTDAIGEDHVIVHPTNTVDLPCPAASAANNNGQSYVSIGTSGQSHFYAVRAQATIGVESVVQQICGFNLGPWGVSAKATAYYDCETSDPKLIRVDVFQCDPPPAN